MKSRRKVIKYYVDNAAYYIVPQDVFSWMDTLGIHIFHRFSREWERKL